MRYTIENCSLRVKSFLVRKARNIRELVMYVESPEYSPKYYEIDTIVNVDEDTFIKITNNLLSDHLIIEHISNVTNKPFILVVEEMGLVSDDINEVESLLINSEGYSYARYSGLIESVEENEVF